MAVCTKMILHCTVLSMHLLTCDSDAHTASCFDVLEVTG